jgi:hypothetical protein
MIRGGFLALALLFALSGPGYGGSAIDRVGWISGSWKLDDGSRTIHEVWMVPLGGTMLGMSRTVKNGKTTEFEYVRIEEREGVLVYVANPSGQKPAEFRQLELTDSLIVFSDPAHDFPQRIRYERKADGSLLARIEGEIGGKSRSVDFQYWPDRAVKP